MSRGCSLASGHFLFRAVFVTARVGVLVTAVVGFTAGTLLGTLIAVGMWWSDFVSRVLDPYLVVLNALREKKAAEQS